MSWVAYAILLLAVAWILQIVGTYFQMRHYREILGRITREGGEGYVGVGNAKATFGKGVVLILVADKHDVVRRALRMRGMTVFARFNDVPDLVGMSLEELRAEGREDPYDTEGREDPYDKSTMLAARRAVEQIDRIKQEKERTTA